MLKHRKENINAINYTKEHRKAFKKIEKQQQSTHKNKRSIINQRKKMKNIKIIKKKRQKK